MPETSYGSLKATVPKSTDYSPGGPDVPRAFREFTDSVGVGQGAGKLLVVQNTGAAAWKAMKGDATLAEDGTLTVADAVITSRKLKPTSGLLQLSESKTLTESLVDMPGLKLEITPAVPSILVVTLSATFLVAAAAARAVLLVDGAEQEDAAEYIGSANTAGTVVTVTQVYRLALTAAPHTIKVQARRNNGGEPKMLKRGSIASGGGSSLLYMLHAS